MWPGADDAAGTAHAWTTYIAVDDAAAAMDQVRDHGGQVLAEPMDVMGLGTMAIALDPAGAPFGVWKAGTHTGFQVYNESGTVVWNEHLAADFDAAKSFYAAVFGWAYNDMSGDGFSTPPSRPPTGTRPAASVGCRSAAASPHRGWSTSPFRDTDGARRPSRQARRHRLLTPPMDSPYGRLAVVSDDQGAAFSLISTPATQANAWDRHRSFVADGGQQGLCSAVGRRRVALLHPVDPVQPGEPTAGLGDDRVQARPCPTATVRARRPRRRPPRPPACRTRSRRSRGFARRWSSKSRNRGSRSIFAHPDKEEYDRLASASSLTADTDRRRGFAAQGRAERALAHGRPTSAVRAPER